MGFYNNAKHLPDFPKTYNLIPIFFIAALTPSHHPLTLTMQRYIIMYIWSFRLATRAHWTLGEKIQI